MDEWDIVIAGAGPVGLALAASLAGAGMRIALVDPQPAAALADPADDGREIALTDRSVEMLTAIGAWSKIPAACLSPLRRMRVLNGPSHYAMHFGGGPTTDGLLGRFAPNHWLRRALHDIVRNQPGVTIMTGRSVEQTRLAGERTQVTLSDGSVLHAALVVAADTRRSRLRADQGIGAAVHDYRQAMLVCPMAHERPHQETATAWFEYGRTLVTLPLNGQRSSAVMTLGKHEADRLLGSDDATFDADVTRLYQGRLGTMRAVGQRHAVPVVTAYARRFVGRRFALLGDAAVAMHPTTAHGFNFGLLGQDALARAIRAARDPGDPASLARYESVHRAETRLFFLGAETIMRLYAAGDSLPARALRDAALRIGNLPPFRAVLRAQMRDADLRSLLRGAPLPPGQGRALS